MCGVFAEFERAMIQERVKAGIKRARAKGTKSGRPHGRPSVKPLVRKKIKEAKAEGLSLRAVAEKCGVSVGTVHNVLKAA
jgi:DNA invertase Pin-like site-specific DNA recombinase